jgi:Protein of unknown function (DUF2442)
MVAERAGRTDVLGRPDAGASASLRRSIARCSWRLGMNTSVGREPHALSVEFGTDTLVVHLEDGRSISAPLEWFPRLRDSSEADRNRWRLIGRGVGIHWETLDEDLSVRGLLEGACAVVTRRASSLDTISHHKIPRSVSRDCVDRNPL